MIWDIGYGIHLMFRYPERFWAGLGIVLLLVLVAVEIRRRKIVLNDPWLRLHMTVLSIPSCIMRVVWWSLASVALGLMVICLAVPERKFTDIEKIYAGLRITFLFDVSLSMPRAEDVKPNRMRAAKDTVAAFIDILTHDPRLKGHYSLAIIPFAGTAQPFFLTFTTSREEFLSTLEEMNENTISRQGTSVLSALIAYRSLLEEYPPREATTDVAIMISDGGKEEGRAGERNFFAPVINDIREVIKRKSLNPAGTFSWNSVIYTVGIGYVEVDKRGGRIAKPVELIMRDGGGNFIDFYREDSKNPRSPILTSQLDEEVLTEVARLGGGAYYHFSDAGDMAHAFRELALTHRRAVDAISHLRYEPISKWFLVPAFVIWYILFGFGDWMLLIAHAIASRMKKKISV